MGLFKSLKDMRDMVNASPGAGQETNEEQQKHEVPEAGLSEEGEVGPRGSVTVTRNDINDVSAGSD